MEGSIFDIKNGFQRGNIVTRLIYINVLVFLFFALVGIFLTLFNVGYNPWARYFELPAWVPTFLLQPWSLITYMFMHVDLFHILFNMLWLYWFGTLFLNFFSSRHLRGLYVLGGIGGGLLYMLAYNIFPYFSLTSHHALLLGASASILAIVVATAVRQPEYTVQFMFVGAVRLKYVALFMIVTDLLFMTHGNAGGHISHLGGALTGWLFASRLSNGRDITAWINKVIDWFSFDRKVCFRRKPKMKVHYGDKQKDYNYNARRKADNDEIDRILDKLRKSGYGSLSEEEKKTLFNASQRN